MLRRFSWALFMAALILPAAWARVQLASFDRLHPPPGCGMPIIGIYGVAILGAGALSLVSMALAGAAYWRLPAPRKGRRKIELALLSGPALLAGGVLVCLLLAG